MSPPGRVRLSSFGSYWQTRADTWQGDIARRAFSGSWDGGNFFGAMDVRKYRKLLVPSIDPASCHDRMVRFRRTVSRGISLSLSKELLGYVRLLIGVEQDQGGRVMVCP